MPCVALLRAVTLCSVDAPPHRLTGATLLAACASVGWHNARLYASSGNVVFSGPAGGDEAVSCAEAARRLEDALATALGARVPVTVVVASRLVAALRAAPPPTHAQQQHFTFLFSPATACPALDALAVRAAPDAVALLPAVDAVVVCCAAYSRCKASNAAIELALGVQATTRSRGTVAALAALCGAAAGTGQGKCKRASR